MKKQILISAIFITMLIITGCKKEGCTDSNATNYNSEAKKNDGSCIYPEPDPDPREPFLGNYLVTDSMWLSGSFYQVETYTLQVTTGGTLSDTIYLNNLWNDGAGYIAIMAGSNFSIPSQQVSGPYYASGNGNFNSNVITYQTSGDVYLNKGTGPKQ